MENPTSSRPPPPPSEVPKMTSNTLGFPPHLPPEMPSTIPGIPDDPINPSSSSSLLDWSDFLDFGLDDNDPLPFSYDGDGSVDRIPRDDYQLPGSGNNQVGSNPGPDHEGDGAAEGTGRVRKRDPRMVCSNFLAGRIPCACPELDEKLEEEMEMAMGNPGKKRARMGRGAAAGAGSTLRCQVPECEADISELKGYHKRHRVCLRCANASHVVLDGESKRYCQQCGKFHILSDFDEGKRSCRRKLERHNNRRRRKPGDSKGTTEKDTEQIVMTEDVSCEDDTSKDVCLGSQLPETEILIDSEGQRSTFCSGNGSHIIQSDSIVSFTASGDAPIEAEKENPKYNHSPSFSDYKSFSSVCPTGRISFKLYDWNPAEFPRRLRHQIFQWLASMPVELEGYIRPGCTIFTVFITMPNSIWTKLYEDPVRCIHNFIISPGNVLCGRGTFLVYLSNMILCVTKDGTSVRKVKVKGPAPKLHYVHPTCFEAGKPMEFIACGSNLFQSKFQFLLSFDGKYLACDYNVSSSCGESEGGVESVHHQVIKIYVPQTAPDLFGPAFVEVENESGLSNFIPILIGDKETCAEMEILQQRSVASHSSGAPELAVSDPSWEVSVSRQLALSEFLLDVAWTLKDPVLENMEIIATSQVRRLNHLTKYLIESESTVILDKVLSYMEILVDNNLVAGVSGDDKRLFQNNMNAARNSLSKRQREGDLTLMFSRSFRPGSSSSNGNSCNETLSAVPDTSQGVEARAECKIEARTEECEMEARTELASVIESTTVPLLGRDVVMSVNIKDWPRRSSPQLLSGPFLRNRHFILTIAAAAVCLGLCAIVLHPQRVEQLATTIRRCLFDYY